MGHDQCHVADDSDHRMPLIYAALAYVAAGMCVHICKQQQLILPAKPPQSGIAIAVKLNGSSLIGACVEIIVADESDHLADSTLLPPKEKGAAFAPPLSTEAKF